MALATQCPHCGKRFRVAADQLKLYGGIVRCGACHEIFDGNASLLDIDAPAPQQPEAPAVAPAHAGSHTEPAEAAPASTDAPLPHVVPAEDSASPRGTHAEPAEAAPDAPEALHQEQVEPAFDAVPVYTLELDHTFDALGILPAPAQDEPAGEHAPAEAESAQPELEFEPPSAEPEPAPEPVAQAAEAPAHEPAGYEGAADAPTDLIEPALDLPVDEELIAAPLPGHDREDLALHDVASRPAPAANAASAPLPMREAAGADFTSASATRPARPRVADARPGRRSKLTPTRIAATKLRAPEIDEPEFVRRSRQQEQSGNTRRILMAAGSLVLLLALATQLAVSFRNVLAARYPSAKPALAATCKLFGCRVELPAQIENLVIETGELTTLGSGSTYALTTLLRNQGGLVQAWPQIELALTDANDKPLLRRVFTPAEYLPRGATPATGFAARAEQPVKLYFQLDQLKPSGYHIAVFYP